MGVEGNEAGAGSHRESLNMNERVKQQGPLEEERILWMFPMRKSEGEGWEM